MFTWKNPGSQEYLHSDLASKGMESYLEDLEHQILDLVLQCESKLNELSTLPCMNVQPVYETQCLNKVEQGNWWVNVNLHPKSNNHFYAILNFIYCINSSKLLFIKIFEWIMNLPICPRDGFFFWIQSFNLTVLLIIKWRTLANKICFEWCWN